MSPRTIRLIQVNFIQDVLNMQSNEWQLRFQYEQFKLICGEREREGVVTMLLNWIELMASGVATKNKLFFSSKIRIKSNDEQKKTCKIENVKLENNLHNQLAMKIVRKFSIVFGVHKNWIQKCLNARNAHQLQSGRSEHRIISHI